MGEANFERAYGILRAVHWCGVGGGHKPVPVDFIAAREAGFILHGPNTELTDAGMALLVGLGCRSVAGGEEKRDGE